MDIYTWKVKDDDLYLNLPPINETNRSEISQLLSAELGLRGIYHDVHFLNDLLMNTPKEMKIASLSEIDLNGKGLVQISELGLIASIIYFPPLGDGRALSFEQLKQLLVEKGVKYGIDDVRLNIALTKKTMDKEKVAFGKEARPGKDAQLKYYFNPHGIKIVPKELADGSVDFYNVNLIQSIKEKQLLFEKIPATKGVPGLTVTGVEIPARDGRDLVLPIGKNVIADEKLMRGYAACSGHVVKTNKKVSVLPVYEVFGDVDFSTGNIEYSGNVIVKGNIKENFFVRCDGDLEVHGNIEGGHAIASGNILIKKGIRGLAKSTITAGGNIIVEFIEHASIKVGADLIVNKAIMHSNVDCHNSVQVGGQKGLIVGGVCRAGREIKCKNIGSGLATATGIEVGIAPDIRNKYAEVLREYTCLEDNLDKTIKALKILNAIKEKTGELPFDKEVLYQRLCKTKEQVLTKKSIVEIEKEELATELKVLETSFIEVSQNLHSGVTIVIGQASKLIDSEHYAVRLVLDGMDIKILSI